MISVITPALVKDERGAGWLHECIASVYGQPGDWEHIVVNDHSPYPLDALKEAWPHVRWLEPEAQGVSAARNQAAEAARGDLLLPLDADDKLATGALDVFRQAWANRGESGIIYSDVVMFGEDYAQVYLAAEYDFRTLLKATFMTVGCLHRKEDWQKAGGWRVDMTRGLEDWEYWITLGEMGVCGKRVAEPLYWYRRHPRGRLQWLKSDSERWNESYIAMRELHRDSYNGRYPMGCCGGRRAAARRVPAAAARAIPAARALPQTDEGLVALAYYGARAGDFRVTSSVTRTQYRIPGRGQVVEVTVNGIQKQGVKPADVPWFRSVNGGRDFRPLETPKPAAPAPPPPQPAPVPAEETAPGPPTEPASQAVTEAMWKPDIMVEEGAPAPEVPDIQSMNVVDIRKLELSPEMAAALYGQERAGKDRKTVLEFLEGQM